MKITRRVSFSIGDTVQLHFLHVRGKSVHGYVKKKIHSSLLLHILNVFPNKKQ